METKDKAKEIYDYMEMVLSPSIKPDKSEKKRMIKEIEFMIDNS